MMHAGCTGTGTVNAQHTSLFEGCWQLLTQSQLQGPQLLQLQIQASLHSLAGQGAIQVGGQVSAVQQTTGQEQGAVGTCKDTYAPTVQPRWSRGHCLLAAAGGPIWSSVNALSTEDAFHTLSTANGPSGSPGLLPVFHRYAPYHLSRLEAPPAPPSQPLVALLPPEGFTTAFLVVPAFFAGLAAGADFLNRACTCMFAGCGLAAK